MVKSVSPFQSLLLLLLGGLAIAGWLYGIHWKRVAAGDLFSSDEKMMIRLQDQIQTLTAENEALHHRIRSLTGEPELEGAPAAEITPAPVLPERPQKIETH
ncbi:MAG: hypothetical protein ABL994_00100 [Verrucomicrobiales bacterium]